MTDPRVQKTNRLVIAGLMAALSYLNAEASRHFLSLDKETDDVRQAVAIGLSAARGVLYAGNLQRTGEIRKAVIDTEPLVTPPVEE